MRYYRIELTDKNGNPIKDANGMKIFPLYSLPEPNERRISSPLQVEFDIDTNGLDGASQGASIVIYGLPLSMLRQAVNLQNTIINIYAGFSAGLPLANPKQQGLIFTGRVWNAYGNWQGVNQTLNLTVNSMEYSDNEGKPLNIIMDGKKGEKVSDVVMRVLKLTYPNKKINVDIKQNLILNEDWVAPFRSLNQFSMALKKVTLSTNGAAKYTGVIVVAQKGEINVFDSSKKSEPIAIKSQDIIGQPTWLDYNGLYSQISLKTQLRADINVGDYIKLPMDMVNGPFSILSVGSQMSILTETQRLNFTGIYMVRASRHIGDYYNNSGDAWVTVFDLIALDEWLSSDKTV